MKARVTQPNGVRQVGVAYPLRFVFHKEASSDRSRNLGHSSLSAVYSPLCFLAVNRYGSI
jgi:hypothetical protein